MAYKNAETCSTVNTTKTVLGLMQKIKAFFLKKNLQKLSATEGRRLALLFSLKSRRSNTAVEVSDDFISFMMISQSHTRDKNFGLCPSQLDPPPFSGRTGKGKEPSWRSGNQRIPSVLKQD
jgi:hypothetical protein